MRQAARHTGDHAKVPELGRLQQRLAAMPGKGHARATKNNKLWFGGAIEEAQASVKNVRSVQQKMEPSK